MDRPKLTPQHQRLKALVGDFSSKEIIHPMEGMPEGGKASSTTHSVLALDGFALIQDYQQKMHGKIMFRGHAVLRYDPASKHYEMHWFDSMGGPASVFHGDFKQSALTLLGEDNQGRPMRLIYDLHPGGGYAFEVQMRDAAKHWQSVMEGDVVARKAARKKAAAKKPVAKKAAARPGDSRRKSTRAPASRRPNGRATRARSRV